jgi:hypothetical protein
MSLEADVTRGDLRRGRYQYFPVVPGRVEFAMALRRLLLDRRPKVVAIELPAFLAPHYYRAIDRLPAMSVILYQPANSIDDRPVYVPVEPADPFTEALRTALEIDAEVVFLEPETQERPHISDACPDTYAVQRIGVDQYVDTYRLWPQARTDEMNAHAAAMAWRLQGAHPEAEIVVVVSLNMLDPMLDAMESPQSEPARLPTYAAPLDLQLLNPHPECLAEITTEYPFLQERYEFFRIEMLHPEALDKPRVQHQLLQEAEAAYRRSTGAEVAHWQLRAIARFSRNLANLANDLTASAYDITLAARSIVDDNFGWETWQMTNRYLAQSEHSPLDTVRLSAGEIWLNTKRLKIRRRLPRLKQRLVPARLKPRPKEATPGEWARQTNGEAICSYPPEDLIIEDFGRYLKQKARTLLSEERTRVEPFTTSVMDGIDIRETIRHWHERKIFVRRHDRMGGQVGSVVVIFDDDKLDRYSYLTTWLGENQNESDMAFYSTPPFETIVGPGIGRAEYGGLLMTLPARRMMDVWTDSDYDFAVNKAERLLLAALDYSVDRFVVYAATHPPRSMFLWVNWRRLACSDSESCMCSTVTNGARRRRISFARNLLATGTLLLQGLGLSLRRTSCILLVLLIRWTPLSGKDLNWRVHVSQLQLEIVIAIVAAFLIGLVGAFIAIPGRKN